jgi:amino acid transporter
VLATIVLLVTYLLVSVSSQAFAGLGTSGIGLSNSNNSSDVLSVLGGSIFGTQGLGWFLAKLLVFMVLTSSMASTLTTILPTARTTLSMAVYKAIPDKFARVHRKYLTPTWSTVGMGVLSIVFYVLMAAINTNVLTDMIDAIGFPIAFYYAMTGFECVWWYRHRLFESTKMFFVAGLFPFVGGAMLTALLVKACFYYWHAVNSYTSFDGVGTVWLTGVGCLVAGALVMLVWRVLRPAYFLGQTLNKDTPVLVPDLADGDLAAALHDEQFDRRQPRSDDDPSRGEFT